jgi:hypothetical protein
MAMRQNPAIIADSVSIAPLNLPFLLSHHAKTIPHPKRNSEAISGTTSCARVAAGNSKSGEKRLV